MAARESRPRLRRSDCSSPGVTRRRRGRGFSYVAADGGRVDADTLERIHELVIPPAWTQVWICTDPRGHLQATGIDAAGRKQYLYHPQWRELRDRQKFADMVEFAHALPRLRRLIGEDLRDGEELGREQVLAGAVRLLDLGLFRIGGEEYAETNGSYGLATLQREHVSVRDGVAMFDYPAKSGVQRVHDVSDEACVELVRALLRRRGGPPELLAYRDRRRWHSVRSDDVSAYLKRHLGEQFSAKGFRTWNATLLAAVGLAADTAASAGLGTKNGPRVISRVVRDVSAVLGNTPAVARSSYIDPRVFDRYLSGWTIDTSLVRSLGETLGVVTQASERRRRELELAVLDLLAEDGASPKVEIAPAPKG
jgi:DNA topoisomerase-1